MLLDVPSNLLTETWEAGEVKRGVETRERLVCVVVWISCWLVFHTMPVSMHHSVDTRCPIYHGAGCSGLHSLRSPLTPSSDPHRLICIQRHRRSFFIRRFMAALIQDEQLTEHSIRESYDDDSQTSRFRGFFPENFPDNQMMYFRRISKGGLTTFQRLLYNSVRLSEINKNNNYFNNLKFILIVLAMKW